MLRKKLLVGAVSLCAIVAVMAGKTAITSHADNSLQNQTEVATGTGNSCSHTFTNDVVVKEATCTKKGQINTMCADCNTLMQKTITPAKGHTYENYACVDCGSKDKPKLWKKYNTVDATYKITLALSNGWGNVTYIAPIDKTIEEVEIPKEVVINNITYQVTKIEDEAFDGCSKLKKVVVGKEVKKIGKKAFANLPKLKKVKLSNSVEKIEKEAFKNCPKLKEIELPKGVEKVGVESFAKCDDLKKVIIGKNATEISKKAFYDCTNLKKVQIGESVKTIGKEAFAKCDELKEIRVKGGALKKIGKNAFEGIEEDAEFKIDSDDYDRIAALFTAEVGYLETMTLTIKKGIFELIGEWTSDSDAETEEEVDVELEETEVIEDNEVIDENSAYEVPTQGSNEIVESNEQYTPEVVEENTNTEVQEEIIVPEYNAYEEVVEY